MRYDTRSVDSGSGLITLQSLTEALSVVEAFSVVMALGLAKGKPPLIYFRSFGLQHSQNPQFQAVCIVFIRLAPRFCKTIMPTFGYWP